MRAMILPEFGDPNLFEERDVERPEPGQGLESVMRPWMSERIYLNFIGDEGEERVHSAFDSETYPRLVALKDKYDPTNMFCLNQNIKPSQRQSQHVS